MPGCRDAGRWRSGGFGWPCAARTSAKRKYLPIQPGRAHIFRGYGRSVSKPMRRTTVALPVDIYSIIDTHIHLKKLWRRPTTSPPASPLFHCSTAYILYLFGSISQAWSWRREGGGGERGLIPLDQIISHIVLPSPATSF